MPLLMLSGLPSPQKKALFQSLLAGLAEKYRLLKTQSLVHSSSQKKKENAEESTEDSVSSIESILVVLQNAVGINAREETARMRSIIQNNLSKKVLVLIYAPLHIKGLRYEIASTAKNMGIDTAHIYCATEYQEGGGIKAADIEEMHGKECVVSEIHPAEGRTEDFSTISRIFEKPRRSDKWDDPCFVLEGYNKDECTTVSVEKAWEVMQKTVKARVSSKKLISGPLNTKYLQRVKEVIGEVLEEKRKTSYIPLKVSRQAEIDFISSIQMAAPPIEKVKDIYASFLERYMH